MHSSLLFLRAITSYGQAGVCELIELQLQQQFIDPLVRAPEDLSGRQKAHPPPYLDFNQTK